MSEISFLLKGESLGGKELKILSKKVESMNRNVPDVADMVLYFNTKPIPEAPLRHISIVYSADKVRSVKNAIIAAGGDKIVFTTCNNLISDTKNELLNIALQATISKAAAPYNKNFLDRIIGIRRLKRLPYFIVSKTFAIEAAPKFKSFRKLLAYADRGLGLSKLDTVGPPAADYLIRRQIILRPYIALFVHHFHKLVAKDPGRETPQDEKPVKYSKDIPVIIISRDRLEPLRQLVKWCEDEGLKNIIFLDNVSTYQPLLKYYASTPYDVIKLAENIGKVSPWETGATEIYGRNKPYVVTDSDVIPTKEAHGAIKFFCRLLSNYPDRIKVGFGLIIDDLPDSYELKDYVVTWEAQFWRKEIEDNVYDADIDTTFALHRPSAPYYIGKSLRTGGKFVARHETWYEDSKNPSKEARYYRDNANKEIGTWGLDSKDIDKTYHDHKKKNSKTGTKKK